MGLVGGGDFLPSLLPPPPILLIFVYIHRNISFMETLYLLYFGCLILRFPDVELNPGPRRPPPRCCRVLCSNVRGLSGNLADLTVAAPHYDILLCSETLVSDRRHQSELQIPGFNRPILLYRGELPRSRGLAAYVRKGFGCFRQKKFECGCCEMMVLRVCGRRSNFYLYSLYRNPDLDDGLYDCLLASMARVQEEDSRASFVFMGDLNVHHEEWLGSSTTTRHGVAAFDFSSVSGCDQMVNGPTHVRGGTLDLVLTDIPDLVSVAVVAPIGSSDHSSLSIKISTDHKVPYLCSRRVVLLKNRVNWDVIGGAVRSFPWRVIYTADDPVDILNQHLSEVIERYVPSKIIRVRNSDKPWFTDECRAAFDAKQGAYRRWTRDRSRARWEEFMECQRVANGVYAEAEQQFNIRARDTLLNAQSSHKWWSTLKTAVFGSHSSLPPLNGGGGGLLYEPGGKAALLAAHFDSKQSRENIELPPTCHPSPGLSSFAFRSREVKALLRDLDPYGGTDPLGMFPLFLREVADVLAPRLSVVFRKLLRLGSFPECWKSANVTPIPKGSPSASVSDYRPISITPVLSKIFEKLVAVRLSRFLERIGVLPPSQFAYRKGLGTRDALLCISHVLQEALETGCEGRLVQLDFSAAFDRVNHLGILYKLCSVGVGGSVLSVLTQFLTARSQYVVVDGVRSERFDLVSGVPQGSVLGPLLFLLYTAELYNILENDLYGYADDSTLIAIVPSPSARISVAQSLNRDLVKISEWCRLWGMRLNPGKTKAMVVSRSRTLFPVSPPLTLDGAILDESEDLVILGVTFDAKLTFEKHVRSITRSVSQKLGIMRRAWRVFGNHSLLLQCFKSFVLPILEYCSPVWSSAADCHLKLLDRVVCNANFLSGGSLDCNLSHRRSIASLCMLFKIRSNSQHPLYSSLPPQFVPARVTRYALASHMFAYLSPFCRTSQYSRSFVPHSVSLWNSLGQSVFDGDGLADFKNRANTFLLA